MSFKAKFVMISAAFVMSAGMARALTVDTVIQTYKDAGFSAIEVRESASTIKVEAVKDGVKLELVYDKASGDVLKREQRLLAAGGETPAGSGSVEPGEDDHSGASDDGAGHDLGDDHGSDDQGTGEDAGDDHGSDDQGTGEDAGDDHGGGDQGAEDGGHQSGHDHSGRGSSGSGSSGGDDDHGNDDHGNDDHGDDN